jgi:FAD/FMN-containing dehydrogenase
VLKLFPQPKAGITALVALSSCRDALALLSLAQETAGPTLTGYELMSDVCLRLVGKHFPDLPRPFPDTHPQYALLELSSHESEQHAVRLLEETIERALEAGLAQDAVVATSIAQSRALWAIREHIPLAQAADGKNIKHDISVPISRIADFVEKTDAQLGRAWPGVQVVCFGHLGDGNLHYNIAPPDGTPHEAFLAYQGDVNRIVHDSVATFAGSISAEHGIGALKRDELPRYKAQVELDLMRAIKAALDPLGIMNPGKIL